jgi:CheY-like chemotaxis protein
MARILVVVPDHGMRTTLCRLLRDAGHSAVGVESGEVALDVLTCTTIPLVILLDVNMGGIVAAEHLLEVLDAAADEDLLPSYALILLSRLSFALLPPDVAHVAMNRAVRRVRLPPDIRTLLHAVEEASTSLHPHRAARAQRGQPARKA